jgi:glucose/arabinose dehydrogenase
VKLASSTLMALGAALLLAAPSLSIISSSASAQADMQAYEVTITNLLSKQVLSPPFLATHAASAHVWQVGQPASDGLRVVAEDGKNDKLAMMTQSIATDLSMATEPLMPGKSVTLYIKARQGDVLSAASMLVHTNDGFTGLDAVALSGDHDTMAYDAGTEENTEKETDVPGPPFLGIMRVPTTPQQPISMHPGIKGNADVTSDFNWSGPAARFSIKPAASIPPLVQLPVGYTMQKVVGNLTFATSMTWDDQGRMYVAEGGGAFLPDPAPARIMRIDGNSATEVVNLTNKGIMDTVVGLEWSNGAFYISHRDADGSGAVSRVTPDGTVTRLLTGISDSISEHQVNDVQMGPDGRMYLAVGPAFNSGVAGKDVAPFVEMSPTLHTTVCADIVLTGQNYEGPDIRTKDNMTDMALSGAFVPFGTSTTPGQRISGTKKCGGSILAFDPNNAEATVAPYAWGFRNIIGMTWNKQGEMYASVNGYDVRGLRPVADQYDPTYKITAGTWYGFPDFSAALEPVTDPKFSPPDKFKAPVVVNGQSQGKALNFVIDHAASGLQAPDKSLVAGLHEVDSSPSMLMAAPDSWGSYAGQLFVAEWGDLAPATDPLLPKPTGYRIVTIAPGNTQATPFAANRLPGSASAQGAPGEGFERPFDVEFGPDGALYVSDYGVAIVDLDKMRAEQPPYTFPPATGAIWKISSASAQPVPTATSPAAPPGTSPAPPTAIPAAPPSVPPTVVPVPVPDMPKTGDSAGLWLTLIVGCVGAVLLIAGWSLRFAHKRTE